jgi:hypothetical protein
VHVGLIAPRFLPPVRGVSTTDSDRASRFSRMEFLCVRGVFDSAGPRCTRVIAHRVIAFRFRGHRPLPDSQISELNIPPAYTPVQRFECNLTAALAWLGARLVRYSLSCMDFSSTAPRRFYPDAIPHSLLTSQIVPTPAHTAAGQLRLLRPSRTLLRYLRMHRICLPSEYRQLTARGLSPRKIRSLVGCSPRQVLG